MPEARGPCGLACPYRWMIHTYAKLITSYYYLEVPVAILREELEVEGRARVHALPQHSAILNQGPNFQVDRKLLL